MTERYNIHRCCLIALLFCFVWMAGIDVFAQAPQVPPQVGDSLAMRPAPKARARRNRVVDLPAAAATADSVAPRVLTMKNDSLASARLDSLALHTLADSIGEANRRKIELMNAPVTPTLAADSVAPVPPVDAKVWTPNPTKATWLAVVFPGAGQIYNRKYWKLPIVYGGLAGCAYALSWNGKMYKDYSQGYLDLMDSDPSTDSYLDFFANRKTNYSESQLQSLFKKRKDTYRRYRDMSIFAFIGVYLISIVDAYVDAELSNFDITPDISMHVEPAVINSNYGSPSKSRAWGLQCALRF